MRLIPLFLLFGFLSFTASAQNPNITFTSNNSYTDNGNNLDVSVKVKNDRGYDITTPFNVDFYISKTQSLNSAYKINSKRITSLAGFSSTNVSTSTDICGLSQQIPDGSYYILVQADQKNNVKESDETDNAIFFSGGPHFNANCPKPNLTVDTTSTQSSINFQNNKTLSLNFEISNNGKEDVNQMFEVGVYLSSDPTISTGDQRISSISYNSLNQNSTTSGSVSQLDLCGSNLNIANGNYYVGVIVDDQSSILENDETDNTLAYQNGPQLNLKCPKANLTTRNEQLDIVGDSVHFSLTIENQGDKKADNVSLKLYGFTDGSLDRNDLVLRDIDVGSIPGNKSTKVDTGFSLCGTSNLQKGITYEFGAIVDPANNVDETDENNNAYAFSKTTNPTCKPNLTYLTQSNKTYVKKLKPNTIEASVDIVNNGEGTPSKNISLGYFVSKDKTLDTKEDSLFKTKVVSPIKGGNSKQVKITHNFCKEPVQVPEEEPFYVFIVVDVAVVIDETREDDNIFYYPDGPHVEVACKPEFKITESNISKQDQGGPYVVFEIEGRNIGAKDAGPFSIGLYAARNNQDPVNKNDIFIGEIALPGLDTEDRYYMDESETFYLCKKLKYDEPYHYAYVIDYENEVDEIREDNNTYNFKKTLQSNCQPDFRPRYGTIDGEGAATFQNNGDTLDVTFSIGNGSYVPNTSPVDIDFFLSKDQTLDVGPTGSDIKVGRAKMLKQITLYGRDDYNEKAEVDFQKDLDKLSKDIPDGDYYIGYSIDPEDEFNEEIEDNNYGIFQEGPHITVKQDQNTSLKDQAQNQLKVYPNPVQDKLNLTLPNNSSERFTADLQTMNGRTLKQQVVKDGKAALSLSDIANGTYLLLIRDQQGNILSRQRVVKVD